MKHIIRLASLRLVSLYLLGSLIGVALSPGPAYAQVQMNLSNIVPGHVAKILGPNLIGDGGGFQVAGPGSSVTNNAACWTDLTGTLLKDCGIPLSRLSATLSAPPGTVTLSPTLPWVGIRPDGVVTSMANTVSNGLAEMLASTHTLYSLDIYGGGGSIGSLTAVSFTGTLAIPTLRNQYIHLHGGALYQLGTPVAGTPSITLDSMVEAAWICEACQAAGATTTSAPGGTASGSMPIFLLDPTTVLPFEGFIGIAGSRIDFGNTTVQWTVGQSDSVIKATMTHGGITHNFIDSLEVNGGGPSPSTTGAIYDYLITGQAGSNSYFGNLHRHAYLHLASLGGLQEGLNKTEGAFIVGNVWDIGSIELRGAGSIGVDIWGQLGSRRIGVVDNSAGITDTCLALEAGASDNTDDVGCFANGSSGAIPTGVNFKTDGVSPAKNNFAHLRAGGVNGVTTLVKDGGTNNIACRGATCYTKDGLKIITVDASGTQTGGTVIQGTTINIATGANQGGLDVRLNGSYNQLSFNGATASLAIIGGGVGDPSMIYRAQAGGLHQFQVNGVTQAAVSAGTFDLTTGANNHVKLAQRGDDTTYNFASLNGVTTLSGGIGIMGGKTGDAQLYLVSAGTSIAFFVGGGLEGTVGGGWKVGSPTGGVEGGGTINVAAGIWNNGKLLISPTAPTISSGFGTSPSIVANNGPAAFTINVGTGGTATSGVIGLPTAANGWVCQASDLTTHTTAVSQTIQTAVATNSATLTQYNDVMAITAWVANDVLQVSCFPY